MTTSPTLARPGPPGSVTRTTLTGRWVHLFGGPSVSIDGTTLCVPHGSRRLLAFLALRRGSVERTYLAGSLWPIGDEVRAQGNLRSALWRLRRSGIELVLADKWSMALAQDVCVDVEHLADWAGRLVGGCPVDADLSMTDVPPDALDMLPGWYDDWVVVNRERIRQRVMHALEALSRQLVARCRLAEAVEVARAAVAAEPLRESAQRVLVEALLALGNRAEAAQAFLEFQAILASELGVEPSAELRALVADHLRGAVRWHALAPSARGVGAFR
jgi:DNA-binding SARP family transcriptional activator